MNSMRLALAIIYRSETIDNITHLYVIVIDGLSHINSTATG